MHCQMQKRLRHVLASRPECPASESDSACCEYDSVLSRSVIGVSSHARPEKIVFGFYALETLRRIENSLRAVNRDVCSESDFTKYI